MMRETSRLRFAIFAAFAVASGSLSADVRTVGDLIGSDVNAKLYESSAKEAEKKLEFLKAKAALERFEGKGASGFMSEEEKAVLLKAERERIARETGIPIERLEKGSSAGASLSLPPRALIAEEGQGQSNRSQSSAVTEMEVIEVFLRNGKTIARLNTLSGPTEIPVGGEVDGWRVTSATISGVTLKNVTTGVIREVY